MIRFVLKREDGHYFNRKLEKYCVRRNGCADTYYFILFMFEKGS